MVFKVILEGESVSGSSPRCIHMLLSQGWRLADPSQTEDLVQSLQAELAGKGRFLIRGIWTDSGAPGVLHRTDCEGPDESGPGCRQLEGAASVAITDGVLTAFFLSADEN
jgi:hypothetical protein